MGCRSDCFTADALISLSAQPSPGFTEKGTIKVKISSEREGKCLVEVRGQTGWRP